MNSLPAEAGTGNYNAIYMYSGLMPCTTDVGAVIIIIYHSLRRRGGGMELDDSYVIVMAPCSYVY